MFNNFFATGRKLLVVGAVLAGLFVSVRPASKPEANLTSTVTTSASVFRARSTVPKSPLPKPLPLFPRFSVSRQSVVLARRPSADDINTGFPGSFGFVDNLGGGLTIGNFSSPLYFGAVSDATNDLHFDGFGFANNAAATTGPNSASGFNEVSFTVSDGTDLTNVNDLLNLFSPAGGDGPAFFVVDAFNSNTSGPGAGKTGLLAVSGSNTPVPEPNCPAMLGAGLILIGLVGFARRRVLA